MAKTDGEVQVFKLFDRAIAKAVRRSATAGLRATNEAIEKLVSSKKKPVKRKQVAAPKAPQTRPKARKPVAVAKPRSSLSDTIRLIRSGGMPALSPALPRRTAVPRGASFSLGSYANEYGARTYRLYIPARAKAPFARAMPLVVMLHGCAQSPEDFAAGTQMNALAEELGFFVVYPAQPRGANGNRCWNWFKRTDQARDVGEPSLIAGITRTVLNDHPIDPARVYVAGLSAGGSSASILAAAYPDLFAAAGVHSGLPAGAAHNATTAIVAMQQGAPGNRPIFAVPTIIFHGDADTVVNPRNGRFAAARAQSAYPGLKKVVTRGRVPGGRSYSRTALRVGTGKSYCEHWVIEGCGHAWSGGHPSGSYTDPLGPNASREMLRFFLRHRLPAKRRKSVSFIPL